MERQFIFFLFFFFLSSCNKAVNFNNKLVEIQKSVQNETRSFRLESQDKELDSKRSLKISAEKTIGFINNKIKDAENLLVPKNGGDLKEAILNHLKFERDIIEKIGRLSDPNLSPAEIYQIENEFLNSGEMAKVLKEKVRSAQEVFAKEHQFKLEEK